MAIQPDPNSPSMVTDTGKRRVVLHLPMDMYVAAMAEAATEDRPVAVVIARAYAQHIRRRESAR